MGYKSPSLIVNVNNSGDVETGMNIEFIAHGNLSNPNELATSIDQLSLSSYSSGTTVVKGNDEKVIRLGFDPDVLIWKIKYTMNSKSYTVCSIYSYSGMEFNATWIDGTAVPVEGSPRFCNEDIILNGTSFIILNSSNVEKTYRWEAYKIDENVMTGDREFI